MTLHLSPFPIAMEPARAAAHARLRIAPKGQITNARKAFVQATANELRKTKDKRDG